MTVNGYVVEEDSQKEPRNWKFAKAFDIAPFLFSSRNRIEIRVTNDNGTPALTVAAPPVLEGNLSLKSDAEWESAAGPDYS